MSKRIENDLDDLFVEWKSKMKEQYISFYKGWADV